MIRVGSLCVNCLYKIIWVHAENMLSFCKCEIWVHARQWVPTWLAPTKKPWHWPPWQTVFQTCSRSLLLEELRSVSVWFHWKRALGILRLASHFATGASSLCWFSFVSFHTSLSNKESHCRFSQTHFPDALAWAPGRLLVSQQHKP